MRTKPIIVIEKEKGAESADAVFCNDPQYPIDGGSIAAGNKLQNGQPIPADVEVRYVKPETMEECPVCSCYHSREFLGDCREDDHRFADMT